jgi:hypothetical protein
MVIDGAVHRCLQEKLLWSSLTREKFDLQQKKIFAGKFGNKCVGSVSNLGDSGRMKKENAEGLDG